MVEVIFAFIKIVDKTGAPVGGVKCTLDGVVGYSNYDFGVCSFLDVSQGAHTFSVELPKGMILLTGKDPQGRPLAKSGTTVIEYVPIPGEPWPEDQPWMMAFTFAEIPWLAVTALPAALGAVIVGICTAPVAKVYGWWR